MIGLTTLRRFRLGCLHLRAMHRNGLLLFSSFPSNRSSLTLRVRSRLLPPEMDLQTSQHDDDILRFVLRGHLLDCYETMYWPFLVEAINTTSWDVTYQVFVRKGLRVCVERIWKNEGGFYHHHHGTWLMLRSCTRSALTLVAARLCRHLDDLLPPDWEAAVRKVVALLSFWQEESEDARDRRYILETLMAKF